MKDERPTNELRYQVRAARRPDGTITTLYPGNRFGQMNVRVLQQRWRVIETLEGNLVHAGYEWRDVPVVHEEEDGET